MSRIRYKTKTKPKLDVSFNEFDSHSLSIGTGFGFSSASPGTSIQWASGLLRSGSVEDSYPDILTSSTNVASGIKQNRVIFIDDFDDEVINLKFLKF